MFNIDLSKITVKELRSLLDIKQSNAEGDELVGRAVGMTGEEVGGLPYDQYKLLIAEFWAEVRKPADLKNLQSASI